MPHMRRLYLFPERAVKFGVCMQQAGSVSSLAPTLLQHGASAMDLWPCRPNPDPREAETDMLLSQPAVLSFKMSFKDAFIPQGKSYSTSYLLPCSSLGQGGIIFRIKKRQAPPHHLLDHFIPAHLHHLLLTLYILSDHSSTP